MPNVLSQPELSRLSALVEDIAFDKALPLYHPVLTQDGYGHEIETYPSTPDLLLHCMVSAATKLLSADQLALYADIIASKQLLALWFAPGADVREGDRVVYLLKNWRCIPVASDSYSVADKALIVTVT